jgi:hypothetical protein
MEIKKSRISATLFCRVDWIRTSDPLHPIQVRYRAAPPPEELICLNQVVNSGAANVRGILFLKKTSFKVHKLF